MSRIRHSPVAWLFVAPALAMLLIYLVYPTFWTINLSFYGGPGFIPTRFVGWDNYTRLFTLDPYFLDTSVFPPTGTVINNIIWLFLFTSLVVALGLVIAVMADKVRYESLIKSIVFMPMGISFTAAGLIWLFMYSPDPHFGIINAILNALTGQRISFLGDTHWATFAIIIAAVWVWTGFCTVILSA
ncbi:MAG TPA: sugar ABC transporter permease, partial [Anaerolineae bacterium]